MIHLTLDLFNSILEATTIKPRLKRELRFVASASSMSEEDWEDIEIFPVKDRSGNKGTLFVQIAEGLFVLPYELKRTANSAITGRAEAIICDICKTWQSGSNAASISFIGTKKASTNIAYLCCADLACSSHVRTKTAASKVSRAQLRENMDNEQRVARLNERLKNITEYVAAVPIQYTV